MQTAFWVRMRALRRWGTALGLGLVVGVAGMPMALAQPQPCGWLSEQDVNQALPAAAPWRLVSGGAVGACQFTGQGPQGEPQVFSINQQFQGSAAEAQAMVRELRKGVEAPHAVEPITGLKGDGFFYWDPTQSGTHRSFTVHGDRVVLMGSVVVSTAPALYRNGLVALLKKALLASPALAQAASTCPYFDPKMVKALVGGAGLKTQVLGQHSCMANNDAGSVLMVNITEVGDVAQIAQSMKSADCTQQALPELGPHAYLEHGCRSGNPHASVTLFVQRDMLQLSLVPSAGEPTAAQRAQLQQAAGFAARAQAQVAAQVPVVSAGGGLTTRAQETGQAQAIEQYNAYVDAYNKVNRMFYGQTQGMAALLEQYRAQRLGQRSGGFGREPILFLNTSMLQNSVGALQKGNSASAPPEYQAIEAVAKSMTANAEALLRLGRTLETYFTSKKYTEDGFALLRSQEDDFLQRWQRFIDDHSALGAAIDAVERNDRVAAIAQYRQRGQLLQAATAAAMLHASDLIDHVDDPDRLRDRATAQAADATATQLEQAVEELRTETEKLSIAARRDHVSVHERLSQLMGAYRDLKRSRNASQLERMVELYNHALRTYERIQ